MDSLDGTVDWSAVHGAGHLYLLVNTDGSKHYEIERVDLGSGASRLITDVPGSFGVSMFSVSDAGMVVAEAPNNVSQVAQMAPDGTLQALKATSAAAAIVNSAGDLALYVREPDHVGISVRRASSKRASKPVAIGDHDSVLWTGATSLVLLASKGGATTWRTIGLDGTARRGGGTIAGVHWSLGASTTPNGPVLLGSKRPQPGLLWWPQSNKTTPIAIGWTPGCASPDGKQILVTKGREVGVIGADDPAKVTSIGELPASALQCGWVAKSYGTD